MGNDEVASIAGYDKMMENLDSEFIREHYVKADEISQVYEKLRRAPGATMKDYLLELRRAKRMSAI